MNSKIIDASAEWMSKLENSEEMATQELWEYFPTEFKEIDQITDKDAKIVIKQMLKLKLEPEVILKR